MLQLAAFMTALALFGVGIRYYLTVSIMGIRPPRITWLRVAVLGEAAVAATYLSFLGPRDYPAVAEFLHRAAAAGADVLFGWSGNWSHWMGAGLAGFRDILLGHMV